MKLTKPSCFKLFMVICFTFLHFSCKKSSGTIPEKMKVKKMVLVYMEANNDLRIDALNSINKMEQGAANLDGVLLVYIKTSSVRSYLLKIKYDEDQNRIVSDTVRTFENSSTSDPEFMKDVISYSQTTYPAYTYGLILWSHATSWAPAATKKIKTKAFGRDSGQEMDIIELKDALSNNFEFILFDACSMGSVEVLYEFKDKAQYIIASPAETLAESFPYQKITSLLFQDSTALKTIAQTYYEYYNVYTDEMQSATVVLVKTSELQPLAVAMKTLMLKHKKYGDQFISEGVQRLDFTANFPVASYDFGDFLFHNFNPTDTAYINLQLHKTILYKAATANFLGKPIRAFSGLTCYIPDQNDINLNYYKRLAWYTNSGFSVLFD